MWPRVNGLRTLELGTPGEMRRRLNDLVLQGTKQATCGLKHEDYDVEAEAIEEAGEILALVNDEGNAEATVEVVAVTQCRFGEITWEMAALEGEGDENLEEWRTGHQRYWKRENNLDVTDDTEVVWLQIRVLQPEEF